MTTVGLERTFYNVTEDVSVVEVCIVVHKLDHINCSVSFPFDIHFLSNGTNDTAGKFIQWMFIGDRFVAVSLLV